MLATTLSARSATGMARSTAGPAPRRPAVPTLAPSAPAPRREARPAPQPTGRRGPAFLVRAMMDDESPYDVLGIPADADSDAISRAYNRKKYEVRGDDAAAARLEAAHSALMMQGLAARLAGGAGVADPSARWADRGQIFPWRPRRADATGKMKAVMGALLAACVVFTLVSPASAGPLIFTAVASAVANVGKLNAIFPPGTPDEEMPTSQRLQGAKNVGRALFLAALATFGGCALLFTLPDAAASALGRSLPVWYYEAEKLVLTVGSAAANWVVTAYYR